MKGVKLTQKNTKKMALQAGCFGICAAIRIVRETLGILYTEFFFVINLLFNFTGLLGV